MKFTTIFVSAFAALAAAAPMEKRAEFDISLLNNLNGFQQVNLNYLLKINSLDLSLLGGLGQLNNFNILGFQNLFQAQQFDLNALLQLQQLQTLLQFSQLGLFNGFDLQQLQLQQLQLGLLGNVGAVNLGQFISPNVVTQVQTVASQVGGLGGLGNLGQIVGGGIGSVGSGNAVQVDSSAGSSDAVTAAEQDAQEGSSNLD
ncbi:hypothetical protein V8F20_002552 [Naviculisporaceae sp. PSN 640]